MPAVSTLHGCLQDRIGQWRLGAGCSRKTANQMFEAMFACFRVGAVYVPMNFRQTPRMSPLSVAGAGGGKGMICNEIFPDRRAAAGCRLYRHRRSRLGPPC